MELPITIVGFFLFIISQYTQDPVAGLVGVALLTAGIISLRLKA